MEKCKDHTQEKQDSGECCQVVEQEKAEQQTYEYKPKTSGEVIIDDTNECEWCQ